MLTPDQTLCVLGQTLAEFSQARGKHPQSQRGLYQEVFREGRHVELALPTRRVRDGADGTVKFTLPVGVYGPASQVSAPPPPPSAGSELGSKVPVDPHLTPTLPPPLSILPPPSPPPTPALRALETESVIIPMTSYRATSWYTLCISAQVGCRMGCSFCETGRMGLLKNLSAGEIVQQRMVARRLRLEEMAGEGGEEKRAAQHTYFADGIQNIVFMGMGEPLDNFENVLQALRVLSEPAGLNFPLAQIAVSTVGRVDGLEKLARLCEKEPGFRNLRLAISLNAPDDALRNELMPINKAMPLGALKKALLAYPLAPRARFLIEYVLIKGVNDTEGAARAVAAFCKGLPCVVNVIPYNPQRYAAYETPGEETIGAFIQTLKGEGVFTKRRITHGRELMSACGQLGNPEVRRVRHRV